MAGETIITVIGNLTADPELRFTPSGAAVASFTVASTPRQYKDGEWVDGEALFMRCSAWRQLGENTAESLRRGDRVIVVGRLKQRSYDTREGEKRTVVELDADEVGPSVKFKTAQVTQTSRASSDASGWSDRKPADDPWASSAPAASGGFSDEPPF